MRRAAKNNSRLFFIFLFYFCLSCFLEETHLSGQRHSFPDKGEVTAVYDGDTIKVRFEDGAERKVRLIGVDAAELEDADQEMSFQAEMAKRFSFFYLYLRKVNLSYDQELEDKYGRLLAYVWTEKEGLFNQFLISEGFASVFRGFQFRYKKEFIEAEQEAKRNQRGLWKNGVYPSISAKEARLHIGTLITVNFTCVRVQARGKFVFLHSSGDDFSALITRENARFFPAIQSFQGQELSVTGFLEDYRGRPQIVVFFPRQVKIAGLTSGFILVYKSL
jgi:micrococcal nuclease